MSLQFLIRFAVTEPFPPSASSLELFTVRKIEILRSRALATHESNVARACEILCGAIGMDVHFVRPLKIAAELHDIGKLAISDALLDKPTMLTKDEMTVMSTHPQLGCDILSGSGDPILDLAASVALSHHECFDGSGYPQGLRGESIPLASRIVTLCDVYDALRADRAYRMGMTHGQAISVITAKEGRASYAKFDPILLNIFQNSFREILQIYELNPLSLRPS
jgi:putative two-component system response regulator